MNHLRSTERSLTLLKLKNTKAIATFKSTRPSQGRTLEDIPALHKAYKKAAIAEICRGPRIRLLDISKRRLHIRSLSSSATDLNNFLKGPNNASTPEPPPPLFNPAKASPDDTKPILPIKPQTQPRFPSGQSKDVPSVTKILQATMPAASAFILDRWREAMIKKLGIAGFNQYQKDTFERGRALHALIANYLLGIGEPTLGKGELSKEIVCNLWKSIEKVVREKITNVRLVEHIVTHPTMNYRGIVDCVACFENELVVIDFKTAEKPKKSVESLYDNPLQITAYCGAINSDESIPEHVVDRNICSGVVIVAYVDGSPASTYQLSSNEVTDNYWKQWNTRLDQYVKLEEMRQRQNKK